MTTNHHGLEITTHSNSDRLQQTSRKYIVEAIAIYSFMVFLFPILSDSIFNVMCN